MNVEPSESRSSQERRQTGIGDRRLIDAQFGKWSNTREDRQAGVRYPGPAEVEAPESGAFREVHEAGVSNSGAGEVEDCKLPARRPFEPARHR